MPFQNSACLAALWLETTALEDSRERKTAMGIIKGILDEMVGEPKKGNDRIGLSS